MKYLFSLFFVSLLLLKGYSQTPVEPPTFVMPDMPPDSLQLRIKNINPIFNLHVDSSLRYQFQINKNNEQYYWFLKNAPVGLRINKDNGLLTFRAEKSYFLSGRLKYDREYKVDLTVQNLDDPLDKIDTSFGILFFNTEVIPSRVKPAVAPVITIDEGDSISFTINCSTGNFPLDEVSYISDHAIKSSTPINRCGDSFTWFAPFDFVKPTDKDKQRRLNLYFIGTSRYQVNDTALIQVLVRENINYPEQVSDFNTTRLSIERYILQLKNSFRIVDKKIKRTRSTRTAFELSTATSALGGTILSSLPETKDGSSGKILPSVGVAMVPVKEAVSPNNNYDQNMASQIRSTINRLEYLLNDMRLVGDRDPDILAKSKRLRDELNQAQVQLIEIPIADPTIDDQEADSYYNDPKVQKKYRLRKK